MVLLFGVCCFGWCVFFFVGGGCVVSVVSVLFVVWCFVCYWVFVVCCKMFAISCSLYVVCWLLLCVV